MLYHVPERLGRKRGRQPQRLIQSLKIMLRVAHRAPIAVFSNNMVARAIKKLEHLKRQNI
jgi:hypothetical protein